MNALLCYSLFLNNKESTVMALICAYIETEVGILTEDGGERD